MKEEAMNILPIQTIQDIVDAWNVLPLFAQILVGFLFLWVIAYLYMELAYRRVMIV